MWDPDFSRFTHTQPSKSKDEMLHSFGPCFTICFLCVSQLCGSAVLNHWSGILTCRATHLMCWPLTVPYEFRWLQSQVKKNENIVLGLCQTFKMMLLVICIPHRLIVQKVKKLFILSSVSFNPSPTFSCGVSLCLSVSPSVFLIQTLGGFDFD